jgi:hypothetical protein
MVIGGVLLECERVDSHFDCVGSDRIVTRHHSTSLIFYSVFLIYTVHSISKATVSTVAIFFAPKGSRGVIGH